MPKVKVLQRSWMYVTYHPMVIHSYMCQRWYDYVKGQKSHNTKPCQRLILNVSDTSVDFQIWYANVKAKKDIGLTLTAQTEWFLYSPELQFTGSIMNYYYNQSMVKILQFAVKSLNFCRSFTLAFFTATNIS